MTQTKFKGVDSSHEVDVRQLRPDTRRWGKRLNEYFSTTDGVIVAMMLLPFIAVITIKIPFSGEILVALLWGFYRIYVDPGHNDPNRIGGKVVKFNFPFRVPQFAKRFDGSMTGNRLGTGITFLGKEISTKLEIWSGDSDLRTHMLVLGTTGSGKTEFLLGLVYNALVQNSGFIYTDGKGAVDLFNNVFRLARYLGREDDLVTINFLTSGRDFLDKQTDRTTNTMNPFALGSSGMLVELIIGLMDDSGGSGDMWKGRAIAFVAGLTKALCFLRDRGYLLLDASTYIEYFELPVLERLVWDSEIEVNGQKVKIDDPIFDRVTAPLRTFILTLPGYSRDLKGKQEQKTTEQHGFITMQLTRVFGDLSYSYGHIFQTTLGEVDMYDVVINRRILVVLLPSLERSPDSLKMLGKLIVGSVKQMMAGCLGNRLEGSVREIVMARPTNAKVPFYCVLDEYGYYAVLGFAVAPAQARSLGFCITFAAQDFSSLQKASKEEAEATWENTNVRIAGRMTGGKDSESFKRLAGVAGNTAVLEINRRDHESGIVDSYVTDRDTTIAKIERLDFDDMAAQENGEFTFLIGKKYKDGSGGVRIIRARTFYTQVKEAPTQIRVNHFIKVEPPRTGVNDNDSVITDLLETQLRMMLVDGKIKSLFPDDPFDFVANKTNKTNKPTPFLLLRQYLRAFMEQQQISLGEAIRLAIVALDRDAEIQSKREVERQLRIIESAKPPVDDVNLDTDLQAALELDVNAQAKPDSSESDEGSNNGTDNIELTVSDEGLPFSAEIQDQTTPDAEIAQEDFTTELVFNGNDNSSEIEQAIEEKAFSGNEIRDYLVGDDDDDSTGQEGADSHLGTRVSPLTFRYLGTQEQNESDCAETEESRFIQDSLVDGDLLLGLNDDLLAIKAEAATALQKLEELTSYVNGATPEPATFEAIDDSIKALLFAAENRSTDFN